jgi:hypothetical protein
MVKRDTEEVSNLFEKWLRRQVLGDINVFKGEKPALSNWHFMSPFQRVGHTALFFRVSWPFLCGLVNVVELGSRRNTLCVFFNTRYSALLYGIRPFMGDSMPIGCGVVISILRSDVSSVIQKYPLQKGYPA